MFSTKFKKSTKLKKKIHFFRIEEKVVYVNFKHKPKFFWIDNLIFYLFIKKNPKKFKYGGFIDKKRTKKS